MSEKEDKVLALGKVPEKIMCRSVFKPLKIKRPEVLIHPGVGETHAVIEAGNEEAFVFSVGPITGVSEDVGKMAFWKAANDVAAAGVSPIGMLVDIALPKGSRESELRRITKEIAEFSEQYNIEILGGDVRVTGAVNRPVVGVTGVGKTDQSRLITARGLKPGDELVVTKWVGLEGSAVLAMTRGEDLKNHLPAEIVKRAEEFFEYMNVMPESEIAVEVGATAMHNVTEGGIFGALWELGAASNIGFEVDIRKIPIRQETIEICEVFDVNPYMLMSGGSMLIGTAKGNLLVDKLESAGIHAAVIGYVTEGADRIVRNGDEKRYLEPRQADDINKAMEATI